MSSLRTNQIHSSLNNCYDDSKFIQNNVKTFVKHTTDRLHVLTHITCLQSNFKSISNKFQELASLVDHYHPKIIGITESWCKDVIHDVEIKLNNYSVYRTDR